MMILNQEDQPVASSLYSSHAGLQVAAAAAPIKRGRGRPKKAASMIMNMLLLLPRNHDLLVM